MLMIAALLLIFNDPNDIARGAAGLAAAAAGVIGR